MDEVLDDSASADRSDDNADVSLQRCFARSLAAAMTRGRTLPLYEFGRAVVRGPLDVGVATP